MLSHEKRPSTILITDAAITCQNQEQVLDCVAHCLFDGSTVVLCGSFSSLVHANDSAASSPSLDFLGPADRITGPQ